MPGLPTHVQYKLSGWKIQMADLVVLIHCDGRVDSKQQQIQLAANVVP